MANMTIPRGPHDLSDGRKMGIPISCVFEPLEPMRSRRKRPHHSSIPDPVIESDSSREILIQAIEKGLSVLGDSVTRIIFYNLEKRFSLTRDHILERPDKFANALEVLFGSGSVTLERMIINSVCDTVGMDAQTLDPSTLHHCIRTAVEMLEAQNRQKRGLQGGKVKHFLLKSLI
jgi:hypothetical protein